MTSLDLKPATKSLAFAFTKCLIDMFTQLIAQLMQITCFLRSESDSIIKKKTTLWFSMTRGWPSLLYKELLQQPQKSKFLMQLQHYHNSLLSYLQSELNH